MPADHDHATPPRAIRPVDAASLILIDRGGAEPKVMMGRRHDGHAFMPGRLVFPGGRVEASDRVMRVFGALPAQTERNLVSGSRGASATKARSLALCAIRETAEETGILFGQTGCGAPAVPGPDWAVFAAHEVYPCLDDIHFVARAITPPRLARRFDTRFFAADAAGIALRVDGIVGPDAELVEAAWLTFAEARAGNVAEITCSILDEVAGRLEAGLERDLPVPFFRERHGRWLRDEI